MFTSRISYQRWNSDTRSRLQFISTGYVTQGSPERKRAYLNAALINARWLKACGVFPSCSPLREISSENMLRSVRYFQSVLAL